MPVLKNGMYYDVATHKVYRSKEDAPKNLTEVSLLSRRRGSVYSNQSARRIVLILTELCNLACSYCYAGHGDYGKGSQNRITRGQLDKILNYLDTSFSKGIGSLQFFGGEPLLEIKAIEYVLAHASNSSALQSTAMTLGTNGTVISDYILQVLSEYDVHTTVSLDGNESNQDLYRKYKISGRGSYATILKNIEKYSNAGIKVAIQLTITPQLVFDFHEQKFNVDEFLDMLVKLGVSYVHISPVIGAFGGVADFSSNYYRRLKVFQEYLIHGARIRGLANNAMLGAFNFIKNKECNAGYCGAGVDELTLDINGDIYPCFMFINNPEYLLGSIDRGIYNHVLIERISCNTKDSNPQCQSCSIKDVCTGCIGANLMENGDIAKSSKTLCNFQYNNFFISVGELLARSNGRY